MKYKKFFACALLALAQAAIGVNVTVGKYILNEMPLYLFLGARFFFTALFLTVLALILKTRIVSSKHPSGSLEIKDWGFLLAQAATGGFLFNFLFFWGLDYTNATSAGIISSTLPAMVAICAYFCFNEKFTARKSMAIVLAMVGIAVISYDNLEGSDAIVGGIFGDFLIFLAMVPEALYSIFNKFIGSRVSPLGSGALVSWLIFLMMLPLSCVELAGATDFVSFSFACWSLVVLTGLTSAFFFWAWSTGLLLIPPGTAGIFGGVMPVVTSILAYFLLGEDFGLYDAIGMSFVFASLILGTEWGQDQAPARPPY